MPFSVDEKNNYKLNINSFEINKKIIDFKCEAVIDTTSTLTSFPNELFDLIAKEFEEKCTEDLCGKLKKNRNFGICSLFNNEDKMKRKINNWLNITINFDGYKYNWNQENYVVNISTEYNLRACLGFERTDENFVTLGTTFLHGYDIIFDRENKKIGFIEINNYAYSNSSLNNLINVTNVTNVNNSFIPNENISEIATNENIQVESKLINNVTNSSTNKLFVEENKINKRKSLISVFFKLSIILVCIILIMVVINYFKFSFTIKRKKYKIIKFLNKTII